MNFSTLFGDNRNLGDVMRRKRDNNEKPNVSGLSAEVLEQPITDTLKLNYMPYAMSVII